VQGGGFLNLKINSLIYPGLTGKVEDMELTPAATMSVHSNIGLIISPCKITGRYGRAAKKKDGAGPSF
jgi:hypothetical protein